MAELRKSLLQFLFSGSSMRRWNDKLRPVELYEIDKQAHKMIAAWMLALLRTRGMSAEQRLELQQQVIEQGLFDYLYRLIITDIKPPVFYRIRENRMHHEKLTAWVLAELQPLVAPVDAGFWERLSDYHRRPGRSEPADHILEAAHLYASRWEFGVIRALNGFDEEAQHIADSFDVGLHALCDVPGVNELIRGADTALGRLAGLCGQLRFQIRWSGTPRVPETSVLGHMFLVGAYAYFFGLTAGACRARRINNFFAGLFHDLPELLTRDIITPVKRSVEMLRELIREYELQEMERRVLRPLREAGYDDLEGRLRYYLGLEGEGVHSEFDDTFRDPDGRVRRSASFEELQQYGNRDELDPKDGRLLKVCDNLAAFMEAHTSIRQGVSSPGMHEALVRIRNELRHIKLGVVSPATLLADFD